MSGIIGQPNASQNPLQAFMEQVAQQQQQPLYDPRKQFPITKDQAAVKNMSKPQFLMWLLENKNRKA
jgi:hypothetical protein